MRIFPCGALPEIYAPGMINTLIKNSKIFIADSALGHRSMLRDFCLSAGFVTIEEAADEDSAAERIFSWRPDLIFLGHHMPEMDGLYVCRELQKKGMHDTVVMMQTAFDDLEFRTQALDAGVTDFITFPLNSREVFARVTVHLERQFFRKKTETDYAKIQAELREAIILQNVLLPQEPLLDAIRADLGLDIAYYYKPAAGLAGDYISIRKLPGGKVALISADISGHGVTAALYAFSVHTLLDDPLMSSRQPGEILEMLNSRLHQLMVTGKFATLFLAIIDTERQKLHYAAAASPSPILVSGGKATLLDTAGHLLGTNGAAKYHTRTVPFHQGDMLFIYSDALLETASSGGAFMKEDDIGNILRTGAAEDSGAVLREIVSALYANYSRYLSDDLSMLICKW